MNEQIQQMVDVAAGVITGVFVSTGKPDVAFKRNIELEEGQGKNLLVVGSIHRDYDDGFCVAVLNPDEALTEQLEGGVGYNAPALKHLVAGRCKAMVYVMSQGRKSFLVDKYAARQRA
jgi:hypothetical protein